MTRRRHKLNRIAALSPQLSLACAASAPGSGPLIWPSEGEPLIIGALGKGTIETD